MNTQSIVKGSIQDVTKSGDIAISIINAKVVVLCDRSGSMSSEARGGRCSYEIEDDIIKRIQGRYQGQIILVAFNDVAFTCLHGNLPLPNGNTNMIDALDKAQPFADMGMRIILITDGQSSHPEAEVIQHAQQFHGKLDTIFVGPEMSPGADFLKRLASSVGGSNSICDLGKESKLLEERLETLMLKAGK